MVWWNTEVCVNGAWCNKCYDYGRYVSWWQHPWSRHWTEQRITSNDDVTNNVAGTLTKRLLASPEFTAVHWCCCSVQCTPGWRGEQKKSLKNDLQQLNNTSAAKLRSLGEWFWRKLEAATQDSVGCIHKWCLWIYVPLGTTRHYSSQVMQAVNTVIPLLLPPTPARRINGMAYMQ